MSTHTSLQSAVVQPAANLVVSCNVHRSGEATSLTKPAITDNGKIKIGGAALSLIKAAKK
jgi:hypothetical protein